MDGHEDDPRFDSLEEAFAVLTLKEMGWDVEWDEEHGFHIARKDRRRIDRVTCVEILEDVREGR